MTIRVDDLWYSYLSVCARSEHIYFTVSGSEASSRIDEASEVRDGFIFCEKVG